MRQASWIAFLLLTLGLVTYEAAYDSSVPEQVALEDGGSGVPPGPKP
jgi:hypothetical protein